jgi:hypothetical protein
LVCGVGKKRPSANGRVEAVGGVAPERLETNRRVETADAETKKGVLTFCRVAIGIAAVRRRNNHLRFRSDSRQTEEREYREK